MTPHSQRWFKISEVQLVALQKGWTHTSLDDEKGILRSISEDQMIDCGCASHSNATDRDDPCIECIHIKKELRAERDKVLNRLCEICPLLDERPDICENCVVETVRKELRTAPEQL